MEDSPICKPVFIPPSPGKLTVISEARAPVQEAEQTGGRLRPFSAPDLTYVGQRAGLAIFRPSAFPIAKGEPEGEKPQSCSTIKVCGPSTDQ